MSYKSYALIIIITGEKTIAKRLRICGELIRNKGNTCDDNSCKAECLKRNKGMHMSSAGLPSSYSSCSSLNNYLYWNSNNIYN